MRKIFIMIAGLSVLFLGGCVKKEKPAITIGPTVITVEEFQQAYDKANQSRNGQLSRREFLNSLVTRKLILQEAEQAGLDKDQQILEGLQIFWEQALMKLVLAKKLNELSLITRVSEKEIADYYQRHKESDFSGKDISEVHEQIRMLLLRIKKQLEVQRWTSSLKRKAKINIDYGLLQIPENK